MLLTVMILPTHMANLHFTRFTNYVAQPIKDYMLQSDWAATIVAEGTGR